MPDGEASLYEAPFEYIKQKAGSRWLSMRGRAISAKVESVYAALHRKYGWQMWLTDFFSRLTGRIAGRAIVELEV